MILGHEAAGSGPVVLLVHAGVADRRMWMERPAEFNQLVLGFLAELDRSP